MKNQEITHKKYAVLQDINNEQNKFSLYRVVEYPETKQGSELIDSWECTETFEILPDLFKITPSYDVHTYTELVSLYDDLVAIIKLAKEFLGLKAYKTVPILPKIRKNLEIIQVCLGEIDEKLESSPPKLIDYQKLVDNLNSNLLELNNNPKVTNEIYSNNHSLNWCEQRSSESIEISDDNKTAIKGSKRCSATIAIATQGWDSGIHTWVVKNRSTTCDDTIGIVGESHNCDTFMGGQNSWGLGIFPGEHRDQDGGNVLLTDEKVPEDTEFECTLNFITKTFKVSLGEFYYEFENIDCSEKLYPAVLICHDNSYTFL
eukprot:TRINITY_DN324_c6_g1_i2.p1 TRINITY_DN324_c6_g1~~TRINITY_DN324_c6_g1_i2.p1  ORF type:complete len:338 (-),score=50.15 TRINITY_DN324_c6_g1_i2:236-1186(-)